MRKLWHLHLDLRVPLSFGENHFVGETRDLVPQGTQRMATEHENIVRVGNSFHLINETAKRLKHPNRYDKIHWYSSPLWWCGVAYLKKFKRDVNYRKIWLNLIKIYLQKKKGQKQQSLLTVYDTLLMFVRSLSFSLWVPQLLSAF